MLKLFPLVCCRQSRGGTTSYASTIAYQYDAGSRMTQATNSVSGTITRSYDALNRMTGSCPLNSTY